MKKNLFLIITALRFLVISHAASAQATPVINARQRNEQRRIRQGVAGGALTRREAVRPEGREADLRQNKRAAKADGVVTSGERHELRKNENQASRAIYRQKHDAQVRPRIVR